SPRDSCRPASGCRKWCHRLPRIRNHERHPWPKNKVFHCIPEILRDSYLPTGSDPEPSACLFPYHPSPKVPFHPLHCQQRKTVCCCTERRHTHYHCPWG